MKRFALLSFCLFIAAQAAMANVPIWEDSGKIYISTVEGKSPLTIEITGESLSSPYLIVDQYNNTHAAFISKNSRLNKNSIVYTRDLGSTFKVLYAGIEELNDLKILATAEALFVTWGKEVLGQIEPNMAVSLNAGIDFGGARPILKSYSPPASPRITSPEKDQPMNLASQKIMYEIKSPDPIICRMEVSSDKYFSKKTTYIFEQICTLESNEFILPFTFADGNYYLRMYAFDGLSNSLSSGIRQFRIDNLPPETASLESTRKRATLTLKGKINEYPAWLSINDRAVTVEANATFESQIILIPGKNRITFSISDEAGNLKVSTYEVEYNSANPEVYLLKPKISDWFKPGSTILVEAEAFDPQDDLADETEAQVTINNDTLEETLFFSRVDNSLSGIITLPRELADGKLAGTIILSDKAGNQARETFSVNIDRTPPIFNLKQKGTCYSRSGNKISLPISDTGSGIDPAGTLIRISGVSFEGTATIESSMLIITPKYPLKEGSYEAVAAARDMVGNTAEAVAFRLVIDPSYVETLAVTSIEAMGAGMQLINSCDYGPSPFTPLTGNITFIYSLTQPADIKLYIFDLAGTVLWSRSILSAASGTINWNGLDHFGQKAVNGVYPFVFMAQAGDAKDIKRGKIIVYAQ